MEEVVNKPKPPYMSFQTFWNFVGELAQKPLPPQIDRSLMDSKSGTDQASLTATLKGFGLIRDDLSVEPLLDRLVTADEAARKKVLAEVVEAYYPDALKVSANNGTEKLLHDSFKEAFGLEAADTRRKAVTFFLHAARTAGIPVSPHFPATRTGSGGVGGGTPRAKRSIKRKTDLGTVHKEEVHMGAGEVKKINFGEAGTVTVSVAVKWLDLPTETMTKLRKLVDELEALGIGESS